MTRMQSLLIVTTAAVSAVLGGRAISGQDKYTMQVPGGLAFSEFRGYEDWPVIAISASIIAGFPTIAAILPPFSPPELGLHLLPYSVKT